MRNTGKPIRLLASIPRFAEELRPLKKRLLPKNCPAFKLRALTVLKNEISFALVLANLEAAMSESIPYEIEQSLRLIEPVFDRMNGKLERAVIAIKAVDTSKLLFNLPT